MNKTTFSLALGLLLCGQAQTQTIAATRWTTGSLSLPVSVVQDPTNPSVQLILNKGGVISVAVNGVIQGTPFMSLTVLTGSERGLLGLAFDPDYATNGYFYVHYTRSGPYMQLSRFRRDLVDPLKGDPTSELRLFRTLRPFANHNAGTIKFGPDRMLYFPTGDGGSGGDPGNRAQTPSELLGKMLRIDPRGDDFPADPEANYSVPPDNPFRDGLPITAAPEIWAFGLRNPWKISFDDPGLLGIGAMLVADVGQDNWEEVNYEPAGQGGRNYGWSRYEGNAVYNGARTLAYEPHTPPIHVYSHAVGGSITGGHVYRGLELGAQSFGRYFFADYISSRLFSAGLAVDPGTGEATVTDVLEHTSELGVSVSNISSIDVDSSGELFVTAYGTGIVYRLSRRNSTWLTDAGRAEGLIIGGQVRSLVLNDNKVLTLAPFTPVYSETKRTTAVIGFKNNVASHANLTVGVTAKMNQAVSVPTLLRLRNWTTGVFDTVKSFNLGAANSNQSVIVPSLDYVRAGDGRIEARLETSYTGVLLQPQLLTQIDSATASLN